MGVRSLHGCGAAGESHSSSLASSLGAEWLVCHQIRAVIFSCVTSLVHRLNGWQQPFRFWLRQQPVLFCKRKMKKVRICRSIMRTFRIQSRIAVSLSLYQRELLSAEIMAGLLARDSSSGRLPDLSTSDVIALRPRLQRRVRGGLVPMELHPSSLSSPCGHRDPIFSFYITKCGYWIAQPDFECQAETLPLLSTAVA